MWTTSIQLVGPFAFYIIIKKEMWAQRKLLRGIDRSENSKSTYVVGALVRKTTTLKKKIVKKNEKSMAVAVAAYLIHHLLLKNGPQRAFYYRLQWWQSHLHSSSKIKQAWEIFPKIFIANSYLNAVKVCCFLFGELYFG